MHFWVFLLGILASMSILGAIFVANKESFFQVPGVLLIEDKMQTAIVMENNTFDEGIAKGLIPIAQGKIVLTQTEPIHKEESISTVYCQNISVYNPRGSYLLACTNDVYLPVFLTTSMFDDERDLIYLAGKRIAYIDDAHVSVMQKIFLCYNMKFGDVQLVKIDPAALTEQSITYRTNFDCLFLMMNPIDPQTFSIRALKLTLYSYRKIDIERAKKVFPFAQIVQRDVKLMFPRYVAPRRVETFIECRNVLYTKSKAFENYTLDLVIKFFADNMGYMNYFERLFALHPRTITFQNEFNKELMVDRREYSVLEQFTSPATVPANNDPRLKLAPRGNVPGYLLPSENAFFTELDVIAGVPIIVGDVVVLANQDKSQENGTYAVTFVGNALQNMTRLQRKDPKYPVTIDTLDPTYYCVTNPSIKYKHECLNLYDKNGSRKQMIDVWDGPCKSDLQCPFYHYDTHTKSYKGRCVNGYCEMPMGYTRIGYTKYVNQ